MLPKSHLIYGIIFASAVYLLSPLITLIPALLILFGSVLIDTDHYIWYVYKKKDWSLKNAYHYLKYNVEKIKTLMIFHTVESHIIVGLIGWYLWPWFFYILSGMLLHSGLDILHLMKNKNLKYREFLLISVFKPTPLR